MRLRADNWRPTQEMLQPAGIDPPRRRHTAMTATRLLKWTAALLLAPVLLAAVFIAIFGWNWLRGPVERMTLDKTGRELGIGGDLRLSFGWPLPRIRAGAVRFANPTWAKEKQMVAADAVEITIDLPQLLRRNIVLPEVRLLRPVVFLEQGSGGPVLGLRDETTPYPLQADISVGRTGIKAEGTITSLLKFSAMDMRLALRGESLAQLFPLLGIVFPETRAYVTEGHIVHSGRSWRYEKFSGRIGASDIAGSLQLDTGGKRPAMKAELESKLLDFADLGPLIGAKPGSVKTAKQAAAPPAAGAASTPARARVLPDLPFKTERWGSVDAEVTLKAKTIRRARELPLENLLTHLSLRDSMLKLDPLDFGVAGGHLNATISLDGSKNPIRARAQVRARKILLAKLFPTVALSRTSIGQINGEFDLAGSGNSVRRMLAGSSGKVGLVVANGEISKMMMEKAGLHLWEILVLTVSGDKLVKLRCGVADFDVKAGVMQVNALVFDTEVTTLIGSGSIDLGEESLDLTLNQKTKNTSPLALRSPIYVRGSFARPDVGVDKGRMAVRAIGAIALGFASPVLALIPLIDAGPGKDSDCRQLVKDARALPRSNSKKTGPRS